MGGTKDIKLAEITKDIWDYLITKGITITAEYLPSAMNIIADKESRQRIDSSEWMLDPKIFQQDMPGDGISKVGPFCLTDVSSTSTVLCLETRSFQSGDRCHATKLGANISIRFPPILSNKQSITKNNQGPNRKGNINNTNMASTAMASSTFANALRETSVTAKTKQPVKKSFGLFTPTNDKRVIKVSGMENLRKRLCVSGISKTASTLISKCRRDGSTGNYESAWSKWASWCHKKQVNPVSCDVRHGRKCKLRNVERSTYQSLISSSLSVQGPRLFNSLPRYIRNINNCTKDYFKQKLDEFLSRIPDEPLIPNYVGMRRAESNSLVDIIKSIGLNELDGW